MTTTPARLFTFPSLVTLALFLLVVLGVGGLIGSNIPPGEWYAGLAKPSFNPPSWVFVPVWTGLYMMIAIAGWRTFMRDRLGLPMKLWVVQMLLNWAWTPIFFGLHLLWPAFAVILVLAVAILGYIFATWRSDRLSSLLMLPYIAWVAFASLLNLSLAWLNG